MLRAGGSLVAYRTYEERSRRLADRQATPATRSLSRSQQTSGDLAPSNRPGCPLGVWPAARNRPTEPAHALRHTPSDRRLANEYNVDVEPACLEFFKEAHALLDSVPLVAGMRDAIAENRRRRLDGDRSPSFLVDHSWSDDAGGPR
jgi:hypothetical protein